MRNELLWASWEKQKKKGSNWISTVMQGPRSTFESGRREGKGRFWYGSWKCTWGGVGEVYQKTTPYREVKGSNPLKSWIFQASLSNCKNCVHKYCEDHSFTWFDIRRSCICSISYIISSLIHSSREHYNLQMTSSHRHWLHSSVGLSVLPVSRGHGFKIVKVLIFSGFSTKLLNLSS